jgi:hypothetical protein
MPVRRQRPTSPGPAPQADDIATKKSPHRAGRHIDNPETRGVASGLAFADARRARGRSPMPSGSDAGVTPWGTMSPDNAGHARSRSAKVGGATDAR